jgi:hypothetical protein
MTFLVQKIVTTTAEAGRPPTQPIMSSHHFFARPSCLRSMADDDFYFLRTAELFPKR